MALTDKERKELKEEVRHKYFEEKHKKYIPGVKIGDIADDMGHSNRKEVIEISNEITQEK